MGNHLGSMVFWQSPTHGVGLLRTSLIGVEEVEGGRSSIVCVAKRLDDAKLHQLVNGKTQRPVEFSYRMIPIEGTTFGVIEIPLRAGHLTASSPTEGCKHSWWLT